MHQMMSQFPGIHQCVDARWKNIFQNQIEKRFSSTLWNNFIESERERNGKRFRLDGNPGRCKADISTRYSKRNFAQTLIDYQANPTVSQNWQCLLSDIERLDYWADKRNQLIHSAEGVSKVEMRNLYREIKKKIEDDPNYGTDSIYFNEVKAVNPTDILDVMERICGNPLLGFSAEECDRYIGQTASYYLYSEIREFVLKQLI